MGYTIIEPSRCLFTDEYCDGFRAHLSGATVDCNPHEGGTGAYYHKRYNWRAGWFDAQLQTNLREA